MEKMAENSIVSRTNLVVIGLAAALFLGAALLTLYNWLQYNVVRPLDLFIEIVFAQVLIQRAAAKYYYELDKRALRITKRFLGQADRQEIPYRDILGIYRVAAKSSGFGKFSRSLRMHSALDGRLVWTVAYNQSDKSGRMTKRRLFFKPSEQMLEALAELLPGKVTESEEEIGGRRPPSKK